MAGKDFKPDFLMIPYALFECEGLTSLDRTVYSVIYWFEHLKDGECRASNYRIAQIAKTTPATVANSLSKLEENGFIGREFDNDGNRVQIKALVKMTSKIRLRGGSSTDEGGVHPQINRESKRVRENSIYTYTVNEILDTYRKLFHRCLGISYTPNWAKDKSILSKLIDSYGPVKAMALMFAHFEWRGIDGTSKRDYDNLHSNAFPITWISHNANAYSVYMSREMSDVWDDDAKLKEKLDGFIKELSITN